MANTYIYNQIVEDTRIDRKHLKIQDTDRVFTICAAGDHLLYYLLDDPEKIVACDINPHQIYLAELKMAYMRVCTQDEYFRVFGENDAALFAQKFASAAAHLSEQARFHWTQHGPTSARAWAYTGSSGVLVRALLGYIRTFMPHLASLLDAVVSGTVQKDDYVRNKTNVDAEIVRLLSHMKKLIALGGGVPSNQIRLIDTDKHAEYFVMFCDRVFRDMDYFMSHNFILYSYITGRYTRRNCPLYMKPGFYDVVRSRLDRIELCHGPIAETILMYERPFTVYVALDHMDWMNHAEIERELSIVTRQMGSGRVLFRTFADHRAPAGRGHFAHVFSRFDVKYIDEPDDIFPSYFSIGFFTFDTPYLTGQNYIPSSTRHYFRVLTTMVQKGVQDMLQPTRASVRDHNNFVIDYYKDQSDMYDITRYALLRKRDQLIQSVPRNGVWLDFACGTGSNLEYLAPDDLARFRRIVLVDISPDLCRVAQRRVERLRLHNAQVVCADILGEANAALVDGSFDVITISYSLTMIPQWRAVVDRAISLLAPGGMLCVCDFTENPRDTQDQFWKWWFSNNHVYMDHEKLEYLRNSPLQTQHVHVSKEPVPLMPVMQTSHYLYIGRKRTNV